MPALPPLWGPWPVWGGTWKVVNSRSKLWRLLIRYVTRGRQWTTVLWYVDIKHYERGEKQILWEGRSREAEETYEEKDQSIEREGEWESKRATYTFTLRVQIHRHTQTLRDAWSFSVHVLTSFIPTFTLYHLCTIYLPFYLPFYLPYISIYLFNRFVVSSSLWGSFLRRRVRCRRRYRPRCRRRGWILLR